MSRFISKFEQVSLTVELSEEIYINDNRLAIKWAKDELERVLLNNGMIKGTLYIEENFHTTNRVLTLTGKGLRWKREENTSDDFSGDIPPSNKSGK